MLLFALVLKMETDISTANRSGVDTVKYLCPCLLSSYIEIPADYFEPYYEIRRPSYPSQRAIHISIHVEN